MQDDLWFWILDTILILLSILNWNSLFVVPATLFFCYLCWFRWETSKSDPSPKIIAAVCVNTVRQDMEVMRYLLQSGDFVIICSPSKEELNALRCEFRDQILPIETDFSSEGDIEIHSEMLKNHALIRRNGGIDTLINFTERRGSGGPLLDLDDSDFTQTLHHNIVTPWRTLKFFFPFRDPSKPFRIIHVIEECGYKGIINAFHIPQCICSVANECFAASLRQEMMLGSFPYSTQVEVVTMTIGHFVLPPRYLERFKGSLRKYIRQNGMWNKQLETAIQLVHEYFQPISSGGCAVPLHVFCDSLYTAVHAITPKRRYVCNMSFAVRLGALLPEWFNDSLVEKLIR